MIKRLSKRESLQFQIERLERELQGLRKELTGREYKHDGWKPGDKVQYLMAMWGPSDVILLEDFGFGWRVAGDTVFIAYNHELTKEAD